MQALVTWPGQYRVICVSISHLKCCRQKFQLNFSSCLLLASFLLCEQEGVGVCLLFLLCYYYFYFLCVFVCAFGQHVQYIHVWVTSLCLCQRVFKLSTQEQETGLFSCKFSVALARAHVVSVPPQWGLRCAPSLNNVWQTWLNTG